MFGKAGRAVRRLHQRMVRLQDKVGSFWPIISGLVSLVVIFALAVMGYMQVEGWDFFDSFYMVLITLSTVGFAEVHEMSRAGRLLTMCLIFVGVGNFAFLAGAVAQILVEGRLQKLLGRHRLQSRIRKMRDHFVVCGYGRIGRVVAREIKREGFPVVVIEQDPELLALMEDDGILGLLGDATSDEMLQAAGLNRARSLITALSKESANVYVVLTARQLNPDLYIIARGDLDRHIHRLERAGADRVVLPHMIGGVRMAQSVLRPAVVSFMDLAMQGAIDLQMEELVVSPSSELVGKNLIQAEIRPRFNLIIVAIKKRSGEMAFNPDPNMVIDAGDTLLCVGKLSNLQKLKKIL